MNYNLNAAHFNMRACRPPRQLVETLDRLGWRDSSEANDSGLSFRSPDGLQCLWCHDKDERTRESSGRRYALVYLNAVDEDDMEDWRDVFATDSTSEIVGYLNS